MPRNIPSGTPTHRRPTAVDPPPSLNKHQKKTAVTKSKLLRAALRIFARDGFEATRIDDIAVEAGYTRGAFYAHFQSKEDLFFAMLEDESRRHVEQIRKDLEKCDTDEDRIQILREYYVRRMVDRQWSILTLEFKLYALRHPKLRAKLAELHRSIRKRIKLEGLPNIECIPPTDQTLRVALQAFLSGLVIESAYDPASIDETEAKEILRRVFDLLVTSANEKHTALSRT